MGLNFDDFQTIRAIMREELAPLRNQVEALENDIKEIYFMLAKTANANTE